MDFDDSNFHPQLAAIRAYHAKNEAARPETQLAADPPVGLRQRAKLTLGAAAACGWTARGLAPASIS